MRNTIFALERRADFPTLYRQFLQDVKESYVDAASGKVKICNYLDRCIKHWPYRCGASRIDEYLFDIGIDFRNPKNDFELLRILELHINLLHWAPHQESMDDKDSVVAFKMVNNDVDNQSERLLENITYMLERACNLKIREQTIKDDFPKYYITRRNASVDATIEVVPELADQLLSYNDIKNVNDAEAKKRIIVAIYDYMEPKRSRYKGLTCSTISEEFFASCNRFGLRHNAPSQIKIRGKNRIRIYDRLFNLALYVLQTDGVLEDAAFLKERRSAKE